LFVRFGTFLGLAHAAMTAEGDNSVLMQKVAKERLGVLAKKPLVVQKPANSSLDHTDYLLYLVRARELNLFNELGRYRYQ
jgi:acyl-CoA oxidase